MQPDPSLIHVALRRLHRAKGAPSTRTVAREIGSLSHTTVAEVLAGRSMPTWPTTEKLVTYLGGDVDEFRHLRQAAQPPEESEVALGYDLDASQLDEIAAALRTLAVCPVFVTSFEVAGHIVFVTRHEDGGDVRYAVTRVERRATLDDGGPDAA